MARTITRYTSVYAADDIASEDFSGEPTYVTEDQWAGDNMDPVQFAHWVMGSGMEPSSSQFHARIWYSDPDAYQHPYTGDVETTSFHLTGFTEDEERAVWNVVTAR